MKFFAKFNIHTNFILLLTFFLFARILQHFVTIRDRLSMEWRSYTVNLVRDNLNSTFNLFTNDVELFRESELQRFLRMLNFMLRSQVWRRDFLEYLLEHSGLLMLV